MNDGMDVINFSGGGPEIDPANDALIEALDNVAAAGVVPVISAGNDRDDFGLGSVGSPGTAPDAISVAAVSNLHVFGTALTVTGPGAPASLQHDPVRASTSASRRPGIADQTLVDVGTIAGTDGKPVERHLCGAAGLDPNDSRYATLPAGSLNGNDRARLARQLHASPRRRSARSAAGAIGDRARRQPLRRGEPDPDRTSASRPG